MVIAQAKATETISAARTQQTSFSSDMMAARLLSSSTTCTSLTHQTLLTGDREVVARSVATVVGIENVIAKALSHDKRDYVMHEFEGGRLKFTSSARDSFSGRKLIRGEVGVR